MNPKRFCTPQNLPELYPGAFTRGSLRWLLHNRENNGLAPAVKKIGKRKLIIDLDAFEQWLSTLTGNGVIRIEDERSS